MIPTYSDYIRRYVARRAQGAPPAPGEHHFVAAYLVPKLFTAIGAVPDYINPDGTKAIIGDVVYYKDNKHHRGIEVKLDVVRLTKCEFNAWVVGEISSKWPNVFLGVGQRGVVLASWTEFRDAYIESVKSKNPNWLPVALESGYGPMKSVDRLADHLPAEALFPLANEETANEQDSRLVAALKRHVEA